MTFFRSLRALRATSVRSGSDRGASAIEYGLLVAGVAIVMLVGVAFLGGSIGGGVASAAGALSTGAGTTGAVDQPAADQPAVDQPAVAQSPAHQRAAVRSCNPTSSFHYDGSGKEGNEYRSPIKCDTTNGTWVCPSGFKLLTKDAKATCQKK